MTIADAAERRRALDPTRSFIVQAPAGSGKTELLIQRYLTLLPHVENPESVLAITFTRKAAGEMRRRVLSALASGAQPKPEKPHEALTWELARAVCARDTAAQWRLLENPHRLRIRTIDSLCVSIALQMPWLSRLGAPANIAEEPEELYREAASQTVALVEDKEWCPAMSRLLSHLDNNVAALEGLLTAMLARRDQWMRHIGVGGDRSTWRAALETALQNVIREALERVRRSVPDALRGDIVALASFAGRNLAHSTSPLRTWAGLRELPGADPDALGAWLGLAELLLTKGGRWRRNATGDIGFPSGTRNEKTLLKSITGALEHYQEFQRSLLELRSVPPTGFDNAQWEVVDALLTVLPVAVAQLHMAFRERRAVDYSEITQAALRALGGVEHSTNLGLSLDYRISHILVDEFQDTSLSQFTLLEKLTTGWQPADGRTLFAVGDPMQSIYRFREAEVGLFLKARRHGIGSVRLEPLQLTANFRSAPGIVEWVNGAFSRVFPENEDVATGAIRFSESTPIQSTAIQSGDGAVHVHAFLDRDDAAEAEHVTEIIKQARRRDVKATIAVLVRAKTHLPVILEKLRAAGMKYRAVELEALGEVPLIGDLIALTRALLHPGDRVPWLAILRAPWCGLTLADLHTLVAGAPEATAWDLLRDATRVAKLSPDGQSRLERMRAALGNSLDSRQETLRSWVEGAWLALGGPACAESQADLESAGAFFELLENFDQGRDTDLDRLEDRVQKLFSRPDPEADETLQIMSIHKAKGLEFDVVILPGLGRKTRGDDPVLLRWLERPSETSPGELLLAPIPSAGFKDDRLSGYVKRIENKKSEYESARLLYVAATRAKKQLHLLGHTSGQLENGDPKQPHSSSLLRRLWPVVEAEFLQHGASVGAVSGTAEGAISTTIFPIRRLHRDWTLPAPPPGFATLEEHARISEDQQDGTAQDPSFLWVGETLRHVGAVAHRMLNQISRDGPCTSDVSSIHARRPVIEAALRGLGLSRDQIGEAAEKVERALVETLQDPRGAWILDPSHAEARSEFPLTGEVNGEIVSVLIDRTFIDDHGVRWIIDFKTSTHQGGDTEAFLDRERERYRGQLERYRALLAKVDPRPIRLGLYFPLLRGWREYAPAEATGHRHSAKGFRET